MRKTLLIAFAAGVAGPACGQGVFDMGSLTNTLSIPSENRTPKSARAAMPSNATITHYVNYLRERAPVIAAIVGGRLDGADPDRIFANVAGPQGYSSAEPGDAIAALTLLGWSIVHEQPNLDPGAVAAVRAKSARLIARNPAMRDPARRADIGRLSRIRYVVIDAGARAAAASGRSPAYRQAVAELFRSEGTDLQALKLTGAGLTPG